MASLLSLNNVAYAYADDDILSDVSLAVSEGERIGIIGLNGTGKSTLLGLMLGLFAPERGEVVTRRGLTRGSLPQDPRRVYAAEATVYEIASVPFASVLDVQREIAALEARLHAGEASEAATARLLHLHHAFEEQGGYRVDSTIRSLLTRMGFAAETHGKTVDMLSGGELARLALCRTLLENPDLLALDEPTNHLDLRSQAELEVFLREYRGAVVCVSHDRAFLNRVANRIVEVRAGTIELFEGNYDAYLVEREARRERQRKVYEKQQADIARTEEYIRRNIAGQNSKQAKGRRKILERLERIDDVTRDRAPPSFDFGDPPPGNKEVLHAAQLAIGIGGHTLFSNASVTLYRGEKCGLVGNNGTGKSTFLRALFGEVRPLAGELRLGNRLRIGYFNQRLDGLDDGMRVVDVLREAAEERRRALRELVKPGEEVGFAAQKELSPQDLRAYGARFLFFEDDLERKASTLSGGERSRLIMARLLLLPNNFIVLDEPTNHLDIPSCEALERALSDYRGTLLVVSHDRYFLDRVTTRTWHLNNATIDDLPGCFSEAMALAAKTASEQARGGAAVEGDAGANRYRDEKAKKREDEKRKRRVVALEGEIATLEARVAEIERQLHDPALARDWGRLNELQAEKSGAENQLEAVMEEWMTLSEEVSA